MDTKELLDQIKALQAEAQKVWQAQLAEVKANGVVSPETKAKMEKMESDLSGLVNRIVALEQKGVAKPAADTVEVKSLGQQIVESAGFKSLASGSVNSTGRLELKATLTSPTGIAAAPAQGPKPADIWQYRVRSLVPTIPFGGDLVPVMRETAHTNSAAAKAYGAASGESTSTITKVDLPVRTIAHHFNVAKELIFDSAAMAAYLDNRMNSGLSAEEEDELLNGDNTGSHLQGFIALATALTATTDATFVDQLLYAIGKVMESGYPCDAVVVNPADYTKILSTKANGMYVMGQPTSGFATSIWGAKLVPSSKITLNNYLAGSFGMAANVWDRQKPTVSIGFENGTNFVSGLATVLAEERICLGVEVPAAYVKGAFPTEA